MENKTKYPNTRRGKKTNGYAKSGTKEDKRNRRREEAEERNNKWRKLLKAEQLKYLDDHGLSATKQRIRLQFDFKSALIEALKKV